MEVCGLSTKAASQPNRCSIPAAHTSLSSYVGIIILTWGQFVQFCLMRDIMYIMLQVVKHSSHSHFRIQVFAESLASPSPTVAPTRMRRQLERQERKRRAVLEGDSHFWPLRRREKTEEEGSEHHNFWWASLPVCSAYRILFFVLFQHSASAYLSCTDFFNGLLYNLACNSLTASLAFCSAAILVWAFC